MNKQDRVLTWLFEQEDFTPVSLGDWYPEYRQSTEYDASKPAFSQLASKLLEKGHLEQPDGSRYQITEKGERYADNLLNDTIDNLRPDGWDDVRQDLEAFLHQEKNEEMHSAQVSGEPLTVKLSELERFNSELVDGFFSDRPHLFMEEIKQGCLMVCQPDEPPEIRIKPDLDWLEMSLSEALSSSNLNEAVIVEGVIRKRDKALTKIVEAMFECDDCAKQVWKEQEGDSLKSPFKCYDCGCKTFTRAQIKAEDVVNLELTQREKQEVTLKVKVTGNPDLSEEVKSELMTGSRVRVLGTPELAEKQKTTEQQKFLKAIDFERCDKQRSVEDMSDELKEQVLAKMKASEDPLDDFAASLAPKLGDLELPKKAFTASLISAPRWKDEDGRLHSAVVSNPGTGKSDLQEWVNEHFDKTHRADGGTGTGTGLTATVEQENGGGWQLVAGPLVFADGGFLQIDEFDKFAEGELAQLNTAMESGVLPVSKASINAELPAEATVMATGNFQGKLSNFDAAYEMLPEKGEGLYDRFALMCAVTESGEKAENKLAAYYMDNEELSEDQQALFQTPFTPNELRVFRHLAKQHTPVLTPEARDVLQEYKQAAEEMDEGLRGSSNRMFKHLIQLSQAVARANLRDEVAVEDAEKATKLKRACRESLDLDLGEDPATQFRRSSQMQRLRDAIDELDAKHELVPVDDLQSEAELEDAEFEDLMAELEESGDQYPEYHGDKVTFEVTSR